jgi:hypothetical protein
MRYKCKETFFNGFYIVFRKGEWYNGEVQYDKDGVNSMIVMKYPCYDGHREIDANGDAKWLVLPDMFDSIFYSEQELREMEINKILE